MLSVSLLCLALNTSPDLLEAQRRHASNARAAFSAAVQDPILKDPLHNPLELAALIAAEERAADCMVMPRHILERISSDIEQSVAPAAKRVSLSRMVGSEVGSESIAVAVSSALFGNSGAPDDVQVSEEDERGFFFSGSLSVDYYDPRNSFLDSVLERKQGIPISLSLIAAEACRSMGCPMVGLNAPAHLLLAPADGSSFVVDCFNGGVIMSEDEAASFIAPRLGRAVASAAASEQLEAGRTALKQLRASPMTALQWGARMLRNLRGIHTNSGDVVRLLGVCDRMRLIGAHSRLAVSDDEVRECAAQVALCVYALRWTQRRNEARVLLRGLRRSSEDDEESARIDDLLSQPWFKET